MQIVFRIKNVVCAQIVRCFPERVLARLESRIPESISRRQFPEVDWYRRPEQAEHGMFSVSDILNNRFTFLNETKDFPDQVEWLNPEFSYLWDFNLHYFEYLPALGDILLDQSRRESSAEVASKINKLIDGWMTRHPFPTSPGWHPYTTSLRVIHWIKLMIDHPRFASPIVLRSLYLQCLHLERNLEKHLLANHLLENGRALLFGGLFFEGKDAERWLKVGTSILKGEVHEEYLPDGGHYERSPMYHCILLEGLLDTFSLMQAAGESTNDLREPIHQMCDWLEAIETPDGWFPLFNDAARGISGPPSAILASAARTTGWKRRDQWPAARCMDGLCVLAGERSFCAIDGAPIGPSYNPGHAHSDNLSYEFFYGDEPVIVDSGTSRYDRSERRSRERETKAHNTVVINGLEQSETWAGFRVARRSDPSWCEVGEQKGLMLFQGGFRNRVSSKEGVSHTRRMAMSGGKWLLVWDRIEAKGAVEAESYVHFAPGWEAEIEPTGDIVLRKGGELSFLLKPVGKNLSSDLEENESSRTFGALSPAWTLRIRASGQGTLSFGYLLCITADEFAATEKSDGVVEIKGGTSTDRHLVIWEGLQKFALS